MTSFTVEWVNDSENQLADIWLRSRKQAAVTAAANRAEQLLASSPDTAGRQVSEGMLRLDVTPLRFYYSIDFARRIVEISDVYELK
jgi:hypothetical protein